MSTMAPAVALAGAVAVIERSLTTTKLAAGVGPKFTAVAPWRPIPVMITKVPPEFEPEFGEMPVTTGAPDATIENFDSTTRGVLGGFAAAAVETTRKRMRAISTIRHRTGGLVT